MSSTAKTNVIKVYPQDKFVLLDTPYFTVYGELQTDMGMLFLHMSPLKKWNKTVYWQLIHAMALIRKELRSRNITHVWVLIPTDDEKLFKFETMMGFKVHQVLKNEDNGEHMYLMVQET